MLWLALGAGLATLTSRVGDWFVMTDELCTSGSRSASSALHSPLPHVHGELIANVNQLYPLLLAPVLASERCPIWCTRTSLNAFVMASAAIPAGLLARRVTGSAAACACAAAS